MLVFMCRDPGDTTSKVLCCVESSYCFKNSNFLKSASFVVIMLLHKDLTHIHSQKKPRFHFGESFTLNLSGVITNSLKTPSVPVLCFQVNVLTSKCSKCKPVISLSTWTQQRRLFPRDFDNESRIVHRIGLRFRQIEGCTEIQTSVILKSRLCQSPSETVGDDLESSSPCGSSEGDGGWAGWGREGGKEGGGPETDGKWQGWRGRSSREDTLHNLCSPLLSFLLLAVWLVWPWCSRSSAALLLNSG